MIAATLKSLSPIGKRLTPMLAISVQGLLFSLGQYLFGTNLIGCIFSLILLSLWAFIQPLMLYMIVFGKGILDVAQYFLTKIQVFFPIELHHLAYALLFLISLKILLAISVAILAFNSTSQFCDQYFKSLTKNFKTNQLTQHTSTASIGHRLKVVGKDLLQLWFLVSLFAMSIFFYLSDVSKVEFIWLILRPVAIGFILFYCIRFLPFEKFLFKIFGSKDSQSHKMLKRALTYFKGENHV